MLSAVFFQDASDGQSGSVEGINNFLMKNVAFIAIVFLKTCNKALGVRIEAET